MMQLHFRTPEVGDVGFIFSTWLKQSREMHLRHTEHAVIESTIFYAHMHEEIKKLLERSHALIACNEKDRDQIYGYTIFEDFPDYVVIHMTYVKFTFRRMGIAKALWAKTIDQTKKLYHTADSSKFHKLKNHPSTFNPYLVRDKPLEYQKHERT